MDEPRPTIFDPVHEEAEAQAIAEAEADFAAGRSISHERMVVWLTKLANGQYEPPPEPDECE